MTGGNCVAEHRRGGEQPEVNCQSIKNEILNLMRLHTSASPRRNGEAQNRMPTREGQGNFGDPCCVKTVSAAVGMYGVFGDRMAGSWSVVNEGSQAGNSDGASDLPSRRQGPCPEGDRVPVRAKKWGNAHGAKGGRDVEAAEIIAWPNHWRSAL